MENRSNLRKNHDGYDWQWNTNFSWVFNFRVCKDISLASWDNKCHFWQIFVEALEGFLIVIIQSRNGTITHEYSENCHTSIAQWEYVTLFSNFGTINAGSILSRKWDFTIMARIGSKIYRRWEVHIPLYPLPLLTIQYLSVVCSVSLYWPIHSNPTISNLTVTCLTFCRQTGNGESTTDGKADCVQHLHLSSNAKGYNITGNELASLQIQ